MLKLYLFGAPRVELDGEPVDINRRKATALLAYLAVTQQPHSREALATLFWPDNDQSRALAYLRTTLWTLNTTLGDHWLDTEHDTIYLLPDARVWIDVHQFRQQIQVDDESCMDRLPGALTLYAGDFMAGFTLPDSPDFDDWQLFQRESLRQDASQAFDRLVTCGLEHTAFEEVIPYARRWLALNRLHEPPTGL